MLIAFVFFGVCLIAHLIISSSAIILDDEKSKFKEVKDEPSDEMYF